MPVRYECVTTDTLVDKFIVAQRRNMVAYIWVNIGLVFYIT